MPWRRASILLSVACLLAAAGQGEPQAPPAAPAVPAAGAGRVIVRVNHRQESPGVVQWEDDDHIVIRTPGGQTESFAKARIERVVRLVDPAPDQKGVVYLRNGQRRQGRVIEDTYEHVVLEIEGIRSTLPRETVDYVLLMPTFQERFDRYREAARTPEQRLRFCQWLVDERRYDLAQPELEALLHEAAVPEAQQLLKVVEAQLALTADVAAGPGVAEDDGAAGVQEELPSHLLSREDVNLVRVFEIDFQRPPRVVVEPDTIRTMIERYGANPLIPATEAERKKLYRDDSLEIVELLFKLRARDLYPQIKVLSEPYSLNLFRRRVHNAWLLNNCATARCHGGTGAGRFFLHRRQYKDERVRYTNLLILQRLELDPDWPLVNYDDPMSSLIVQYALPRQIARKPHPHVPGWTPVFGRGGERMLDDTVKWIDAMMRPRPVYPVDYEPPHLGAADAAPGADPAPFEDAEPERVPR